MKKVTFNTKNEHQTRLLGSAVAKLIPYGQVIALNGELAAGKSVFSSSVIRELGYEGKITSPTYTILNTYDTLQGVACHMDAYRLSDSEELDFIGYYDLLDECVVMLIEWAEIIEDVLDENTLFINITKSDDDYDERIFCFNGEDTLINKLTEGINADTCH